jgi:hypothetical protein
MIDYMAQLKELVKCQPNTDKEGAIENRAALRLYRRYRSVLGDLLEERDSLAERIARYARRRDVKNIEFCNRRLADTLQTISILEKVGARPIPLTHEYVFSSWILRDSFHRCMEREEEGIHFIAGIQLEEMRVATRIISFPYAYRSVAGAKGDHRATHQIMIETHEMGHTLLALIHSHPGTGLHANRHSTEDHRTHTLWEKTSRMIGGIWSRDGYLRFFSVGLPFSIRIVGDKMQEVERNVFQIVLQQT